LELLVLSVSEPQPEKLSFAYVRNVNQGVTEKNADRLGFYANCYSESWNFGIYKKSLDAYIFFFFFPKLMPRLFSLIKK
jgi:hypothetical protein